jgi:hypothetical protein
MKKLLPILLAVFLTAGVFMPWQATAQAPEKMGYQAVIRNNSNQLMTNHAIGMQISILSGSPDGMSVFVERHFPTTNSNGLVTIEVGTGTLVSGNFSTIDWSNELYFIKTETDLNGGANYTIFGTNQILSVPYALHAKTAETITGAITETDPVFSAWDKSTGILITESQISDLGTYLEAESDPVFGSSIASGITPTDTANWNNKLDSYTETDPGFSASQAANITATDITNLSHLSGTNTGDQDISGIAVNTKAIQDTAAQIRADIPSVNTYSAGDFAQGGIVFWVDETGQHGLVCAKEDQSTGVKWYPGTLGSTQAKGDGPFAGEANTSIIIAAHVAIGDDGSPYAARICNELQVTEDGKTYGDWYLPSKEELNLMYQNKATINTTARANGGSDFAISYYWSSSEGNSDDAWMQDFDQGYPINDNKYYVLYVRAVRAF